MEQDRGRKRTIERILVSPEPASDQSRIQNVLGFLQDCVPQAVSGPKEERKERVLWANFESGDINDVGMEHRHGGGAGNHALPLLLVLGFSSGYSVWMIPPGGDAQELHSAHGDGETARTVRLLRTPEAQEGVGEDRYARQRPIMAVVRRGRVLRRGSPPTLKRGNTPYSTLYLISLRGGEGDGLVKKISFEGKSIADVKCNRRVVVVVLQKRIFVLDAGSYENKFSVKNGYPSLDYPCNPVALGTRWLAFAETKLVSKHQSIGGMSDATPPSVTTSVIKGVKKGISALTETISGLTGRVQQSPQTLLDTTPQTAAPSPANIVSIVDAQFAHPPELRLQEVGREAGVVAHFVAHTGGPSVHVAALAFNPSGNLLVTACTEGNTFHVFHILPHLWLSSEAAVHHLYTLYRGATAGLVQDICFSLDSRWVVASTLNGTTHVFPITPYGGDITVRTHTTQRVVNQLSRFQTSAGIDSLPSHLHHSQLPLATSAGAAVSGGGVEVGGRDYNSVVASQAGPSACSWSNPRGLPLPSPVITNALQLIKQPYLPSTGEATGKGSSAASAAGTARGYTRRGEGEDVPVTLAGPDAVCVRAVFSPAAMCEKATRRSSADSAEPGASYLLYVVGSNGVVTEHQLDPTRAVGAPDGDDAPIELAHQSRLCWRLLSNPSTLTTPLPLTEDNPLIIANDEFRTFQEKAKQPQAQSGPKSDREWLSQVEILSHAPPSRRLWMGPQFSFKPHPPPSSSSSLANPLSAVLKTPSPPHTVIYSNSVSSTPNPVEGSSDLMAEFVRGEGEEDKGEEEGSGASDQGAVLSPSSHALPLIDLLSEPLDSRVVHSRPLSMPTVTGETGTDSGPASMEPGTVEVFGSWTKVAPRLDAAMFEGDLERQLAEAIGEHEQSAIKIVAGGKVAAQSGFHPPEDSQ